jgi:hypothetical protein
VEVVKNAVSVFKLLEPVLTLLVGLLQIVMTVFEMTMAPLRPLIEVLGFLLKMILLPLIMTMQVLQAALKPVLALFDMLSALGSAFMDTVGELFTMLLEGLGIKDLLKSFADAIKDATLSIVAAIARFLMSLPFGWGKDVLDKMIGRLEGTAHALATPKEVSFKGVEQITKDIAAAAFVAGYGKEKQEDLMEQMLTVLKEIRDGDKGGTKERPPMERVRQWVLDHPGMAAAAAATGPFGMAIAAGAALGS